MCLDLVLHCFVKNGDYKKIESETRGADVFKKGSCIVFEVCQGKSLFSSAVDEVTPDVPSET